VNTLHHDLRDEPRACQLTGRHLEHSRFTKVYGREEYRRWMRVPNRPWLPDASPGPIPDPPCQRSPQWTAPGSATSRGRRIRHRRPAHDRRPSSAQTARDHRQSPLRLRRHVEMEGRLGPALDQFSPVPEQLEASALRAVANRRWVSAHRSLDPRIAATGRPVSRD
jgi:hypothetical protein